MWGVNRPECEDYQSSSSSAEVKTALKFSSTFPIRLYCAVLCPRGMLIICIWMKEICSYMVYSMMISVSFSETYLRDYKSYFCCTILAVFVCTAELQIELKSCGHLDLIRTEALLRGPCVSRIERSYLYVYGWSFYYESRKFCHIFRP